jgi:hypothetical protein
MEFEVCRWMVDSMQIVLFGVVAGYPQACCTSRLGTRPAGDMKHTESLR